MLAKEYDMEVICSDLTNPKATAQMLHNKYKLNYKIQYESIDCTKLLYKENFFDVVIFKSVIGALGSEEKQRLAIQEILRVLKPGGVLLFAENLNSSFLHTYLRRKFVPWSFREQNRWRYLKLNEMYLFLNKYNFVELNTTGFFANLVGNNLIKNIISYFDYVFEKLLPKKLRYIVYGAAIK
jgi:ubiquinone/menaquinone biosynthesis C-methylase UbiE